MKKSEHIKMITKHPVVWMGQSPAGHRAFSMSSLYHSITLSWNKHSSGLIVENVSVEYTSLSEVDTSLVRACTQHFIRPEHAPKE